MAVSRFPTIAAMPYLTDPETLAVLLPGEPSFREEQLRDWLYRTPVLEADDMTNLPQEVRDRLAPRLWPFTLETEQVADGDSTRKWLFRTPDGASIEAVLMGYSRRVTLCISSQVGCAMGCTFCATGQFGFERHLLAGEIVAQVAYARAFLRAHGLSRSPDRVTNVVFMGMGEPLANYEHLRESIRRMVEYMGIGARAITVSTVGVVPGMRRLAKEPWQVGLAVSLHAADDATRDRIVPLNRRYPLREVIDAAAHFFDQTGRRVSIEWTLIAGTNDDRDQAARLSDIAHELHAHVNVIPLNVTPLSPDRPPSSGRTQEFMAALVEYGVNATLRDTRGSDIDAACGQLRLRRATDSIQDGR
jgi:23S rRNA (adenine2503-C2)-methyltransferase